ncbi:MAG TPA: hypothetical protein VK819_12415 [Acidobacteriaceae bacterium]|jgi:hypothetical protein|nr:hypothetical protein [Acidobacteriaceae bacterium]
MKKLLLIASVALLSLPPAFAQRVYVGVAPPPVVVEHRGPRPHGGMIWVGGHHRWDGHGYVWVGGYWADRPHPGAVWVPGHWGHEPGGYFWVEGHWR